MKRGRLTACFLLLVLVLAVVSCVYLEFVPRPVYASTSSSWQVSASSDDSNKNDQLGWSNTRTPGRVGRGGTSGGQRNWFRWNNVNIAKGSTISSAIFSYYYISQATPPTIFYGIDEDNTTTFSSDPSARALTSASVTWTFTTNAGWNNSSDISSMIAEITSRDLWVSGNSLGIYWGNATWDVAYADFVVWDTNSNSTFAPKLYVTWTTGETVAPTYSNAASNSTRANSTIEMDVLFNDGTNVSGYVWCWNSSGLWTNNSTWVAFSTFYNTTAAWANKTATSNATVGLVIGWQMGCNDTYNNWVWTSIQTFTTTFYSSLNVVTTTHSWTINPGQTNVTVTEGTINLTITANVAFKVQAKGDGNLIYGSNSILLSNVLMNKDNLAAAISLTTDYQDIPGLTNQGAGTDVAVTFVLWLSVPLGKRAGTYTYTLQCQVLQN